MTRSCLRILIWLTNGVQVGFVIGALAASLVNLPDLVRLSCLWQPRRATASLSTFLVVASGILGCLLGGYLSDRIGRTAGMMLLSGSCALLMCFRFTGPLWLFMLVAIVWGIW